MNEEIHFEIGEKYENMKGVFEVIAIHRDSMEIRWENGEEISTPIALQQRIIERIRFEKAAEKEATQKKKAAKAAPARRRRPFSGLEADAFGASAVTTAWRGRGQLGGAVARQLAGGSFTFNSWAVLRKPEVQWLDVGRQKQADLDVQAKFYARLDDRALYYGFHVPAPHPPATRQADWDALLAWLGKSKNETWLKKQCTDQSLYLVDRSARAFDGHLEAGNAGWRHVQTDGADEAVDRLGAFLAAAATSAPLDLCIETRIDRGAAIDRQEAIATDIAALFGGLVPLYAAAASRTP